MGVFRVSKNQCPGNVRNCPGNKNIFFLNPVGGGFRGSKYQKSGKFHELPRKSKTNLTPPPLRGWRDGGADGRDGTGREKGRGRQAGKEGPERSRVTS